MNKELLAEIERYAMGMRDQGSVTGWTDKPIYTNLGPMGTPVIDPKQFDSPYYRMPYGPETTVRKEDIYGGGEPPNTVEDIRNRYNEVSPVASGNDENFVAQFGQDKLGITGRELALLMLLRSGKASAERNLRDTIYTDSVLGPNRNQK